METVRKPLNEDRVALLLGSVIFILALLKFGGIDMLGWAVKTGMWVDNPLDAWKSATKGLLPGYGALFVTYAVLTGALACGVKLMGNDVAKFVKSFTIIFFIAIICYTLGANAYIAANPTQLKAQGIPWALGLSRLSPVFSSATRSRALPKVCMTPAVPNCSSRSPSSSWAPNSA